MIGCIIFIIIFLVGILYTVKNKNKKNELMVSLYDSVYNVNRIDTFTFSTIDSYLANGNIYYNS